jgi:uncharacterized membrane protein
MKIEWVAEHWEVITVIAALVLRELTKNMAKHTAAKLIEHFLSPQAKEINEIKQNIKIIQDHLGVEGEWSDTGAGRISFGKARSLTRSFAGFSRVILRRTLKLRRRKRMNQGQINWMTLIPALLGALKLILQPFGIVIEDEQINEITNGAAALLTVIGVIMSHRKTDAAAQTVPGGNGGAINAQRYGDHGPSI